jgi:mannose-6-phosphate isomerase-like protein (cupin superfamily)
MKAICIRDKFEKFTEQWSPRQIAEVDDMQVLLARLQGDFIWHKHELEDELFQVIQGTLYMEFRDRCEVVQQGELIVVPKGVEHKPYTKDGEEVLVLLFEKKSTAHTGNVVHKLTKTHYPKI